MVIRGEEFSNIRHWGFVKMILQSQYYVANNINFHWHSFNAFLQISEILQNGISTQYSINILFTLHIICIRQNMNYLMNVWL